VCAALVAGRTAADTSVDPRDQRRPTWTADIAPIIVASCSPCHRPDQPGPFQLLSYDDARAKGKEIAAATSARRMPPWLPSQPAGFAALAGDRRLTDRQIAAIAAWVSNGMPVGDPKSVPVLPIYPSPWPLGVPDLTLGLPRIIPIPAGSGHDFRNVVVPVGIPADVWIRAIDYRGSSTGVAGARIFLAPPDLIVGEADPLPGLPGLLGAGSLENYVDRVERAASALIDLGPWVPGVTPRGLPEGLAIRVPGRSNIVVQFHLRSGEIDALEEGRLAIYYAPPAARRSLLAIDVPPLSGFAAGIDIPAGAARHVQSDAFTLPVDVEAVGARGLANDLARRLTLSAVLPGGASRGLLEIDRWQPAWPESYFFAASQKLPKGTVIRAETAYDNSTANPRNLFLPPRRIGWGRAPAAEILSLSLLVVEPPPAEAQVLREALAAHFGRQLRGR
jgi:mono/diheme cytochrome c family protein